MCFYLVNFTTANLIFLLLPLPKCRVRAIKRHLPPTSTVLCVGTCGSARNSVVHVVGFQLEFYGECIISFDFNAVALGGIKFAFGRKIGCVVTGHKAGMRPVPLTQLRGPAS